MSVILRAIMKLKMNDDNSLVPVAPFHFVLANYKNIESRPLAMPSGLTNRDRSLAPTDNATDLLF